MKNTGIIWDFRNDLFSNTLHPLTKVVNINHVIITKGLAWLDLKKQKTEFLKYKCIQPVEILFFLSGRQVSVLGQYQQAGSCSHPPHGSKHTDYLIHQMQSCIFLTKKK